MWFEIGQKITINKFAFTLKEGGTGMSDWIYNEMFTPKTTVVEIIEFWHDYETGWRFIGKAVDPVLQTYLARNASPEDQRVFVSEFDIVKGE
jgi:hypothetical protein